MTDQSRSKVAPRRSQSSITGLLRHSRALHDMMEMMEHQDEIARLSSEKSRVCSPRRRECQIQDGNQADTMATRRAKPLTFRKTKRELEREQQQAQRREKRKIDTDA
ncbi:hypothetical protein PsorP6_012511 [Peronosclerospora sorghi]|uniref:Uncharacterized protein n=1 Tax=Peronosclerospora sorghi TaxID=230839 RepID=A0ACC0WHV6_9STRA|nr:hypothetical protein PsorP6_012511 [Peronosclerospora sorghi]